MSLTTMKKWKFVGGRICLDFINSVGGRVENNDGSYTILEDKVKNYGELVDWAKAVKLLNNFSAGNLLNRAANETKEAGQIFIRAITLRESMYRIFRSVIENHKPQDTDIEILNNECSIAHSRRKLIYNSKKFTLNLESMDNLESIIWLTALSAEELLVSEQLNRVKQCPGENCGWLFLDTSKNGSRQWCDMKDCGNLAKVRRFRLKKTG